tara:strand:+ start:122 stop:751 length:630 start_codon:yes stop_codon:yes gene_type:complete
MTKYKTTKTTVTVLEKLGAGAETIEAFEAGALVKIGQAAKGADDVINPLIQTMYTNGIRAKDWMAKAGLPAGSKIPATHTKAYKERLAFFGQGVWSVADKVILKQPAPKVGDFKTKGDFLAAKAERKALQDKPSTKMKNLAKRFATIAKNDPDNKEVNSANAKATAIEALEKKIAECIKLLQSDRPFPDTFDHDMACSTLIAYKNTYIK